MIHTCACFIASLVCKYDVVRRPCRCENANMQIQLASIACCVRAQTDEGNTNQMRHVNNRQTDDSHAIFTTRSAHAKLTAANYLPTSLGESCSEHTHARFPPICVRWHASRGSGKHWRRICSRTCSKHNITVLYAARAHVH